MAVESAGGLRPRVDGPGHDAVVKERVVKEPVVREPVVKEPLVKEPIVDEPLVNESTGKDEERVLSPRPVHVTVVVAPPAAGTEGMAPAQPTSPAAPPIALPWADMVAVPDPLALSPVAAVAPEERTDQPQQRATIQAEPPSGPRASRATAPRRYRFAHVGRLAKRGGAGNYAQAPRVDGSPKHASWMQSLWQRR